MFRILLLLLFQFYFKLMLSCLLLIIRLTNTTRITFQTYFLGNIHKMPYSEFIEIVKGKDSLSLF